MTPTLISYSHSRGRLAGIAILLGALVACVFAGDSKAAILNTIVDSQGFELPKFDPAYLPPGGYTGQLEGQAPFPEPLPVGTWMRTKNTGNSTAAVVNTVAEPSGGTQSVKVDRAANSEVRWAVPVSGWPSERYVCIDWDMRVEASATPVGSFGPFFGIEAYDDDAASIGLLASLGVDAATGEVLFQEGDDGFLVAPGPVVVPGAWNHFTILLDYVDHDFEVYLNMVQVNLNPLISDEFVDHDEVVGGLNEFTDADIAALAAGGDPGSQIAIGTAYFDNFSVVESDVNPCIPEPTTLALVALGFAGLQGVQRNRRK